MHFDLEDLLGNQINPDIFKDIEQPFLDEEINNVVKELPTDKTRGPDGFNNEFLKACWDIIGADVRKLVHAFHEGLFKIVWGGLMNISINV